MSDEPNQVPLLRVVRGEPDAAELAALVAVLAARSGEPATAPVAPTVGRWSDPAHAMRRTFPVGHGGWTNAGRVG